MYKSRRTFIKQSAIAATATCFSALGFDAKSYAGLVANNQRSLRKLYQISTDKSFDIDKLPPQTKVLYQAFLNSWDAQSFSPNFRQGLFSAAYPDKINLYGIRSSKTYQNYIKSFIEEGIQDPRLIEIIYNIVEPILSRFETNNVLWAEGIPLPGASDDHNIVQDKWASDYKKIFDFGNNDKRSAAARRRAWAGKDVTKGPWGVNPTEEERKSPAYRRNTIPKGRKRILYLNEHSDFTSIPAYGTSQHALDLQLGSQHLFWAGYILDVNKALDPRYGKAADILWDYKINHWELDAPGIMGPIHPVYKFYSKPSTLHHSNDAHASLFHSNVVWHQLREGKPRPDDEIALKYLVQTILDDTHLIPVPPEVPDYDRYKGSKIANYCHWNNATNKLLGFEQKYLPGDVTYSQERAGTLVSLMHGKVKGTSGKMISDELMESLSNMYALIIERGKPESGIWGIPNEVSGFNKKGPVQESTVLFNNGKTSGGFIYGGSAPIDLLQRDAAGDSGGFYLSWDKVGRHIALKHQRGKNHQFVTNRFDVAEVLKNPKHEMTNTWTWVSAYLLLSLRRPELNLSEISFGNIY